MLRSPSTADLISEKNSEKIQTLELEQFISTAPEIDVTRNHKSWM